MSEHTYSTWFSGVRPVSYSNGVLHLQALDKFSAEWLEDKYGALLHEIGTLVAGKPVAVRLTFRPSPPDRVREVPEVELDAPAAPTIRPAAEGWGQNRRRENDGGQSTASLLNPRYTFERFVVGENSRVAHAASRAVAEQPAEAYNPLFLYGATGLGKTHLMQAIANSVLSSGSIAARAADVCYIPAEQFMNEMVTAIQNNRTDQFRARYRSYRLLLVDDVQFLRRKEHTQEEFFHTFNALYNNSCQIVLTSDRHPKELRGLEERLVSRFEWGLVVDVNSPSYETRVAILRKKAEEDHVFLDADILDLIARCCRSSVRELEGALIKILALSSLSGQELTLELAEAALHSLLGGTPSSNGTRESCLVPESIRDQVAVAWGVSGDELASISRSRKFVLPRQVAMLLIMQLLDVSLNRVGKAFGGRHHSTVLHSIRKMQDLLARDDDLREKVENLRRQLARLARDLARPE